MRKEASAREAELKEEAAAARAEAEAAAQLVHALQPKGEFVLGTLWTKVLLPPDVADLLSLCRDPACMSLQRCDAVSGRS